jgi:hypothetical protein
VAGDRATVEKDAVALIEFRLSLDRERERVPFFKGMGRAANCAETPENGQYLGCVDAERKTSRSEDLCDSDR